MLIGYRKLILTLISTLLLTLFLLSGHVNGVSYASALSGMVIAYNTANLSEHLVNLGKEYITKNTKEK